MKKALSLLLVLTLILGVFPISVYAEETTAATITMTTDATESLKIGDTFSVTAALSNNPGYASITLTLLWNSNVVKFTGFATEFDEDEEVDVLKDTIIGGNIVINNDVGIITSGRTNNSSKNGTLFIANFEVIGYGQCNISLDRSDITKFTLANLNKDQISVNYVDTAVAPLVVSEPVDEDAFTVYYQIEDTIVDDDSDTVHEVDLDTNFNVGVYVKAGAEQVMQAFDIYPEWNENLEFVSVAGEDNVTTIVDKMADTDPHFQTQFEDSLASTDVTITTTGTKIATLTMKLKASAIYDTHYPIWIEAATNLAKEKDPESVKKVTVTAEGDFNVETLKTYTVTYDANNGTWGDGVADPTLTKKHGVDLDIVPPTTNPTRTNYSFQGWSTDSGDGNTVNAPTTYTANEDKTLYAVWKQNVFTVRFFDAEGKEIEAARVTDVKPNDKVSFTGTTPTKTSTAQYEYNFKGWGVGEKATTTVDLTTYEITKDTDFYPLYEAVTRKYTVIWYDEDGTTVLNTTMVEYGETPAYTGTPTKTDTAEYDYSFAGWSATKDGDVLATLPTVVGDEEYYAVFTAEKRSYEVTYVDGEHGTLEGKTTESVAYGSNPTIAPTVKPADGYTFIGWSNGTTISTDLTAFEIQGTTTLTAQYTVANYTITLDPDNGNVTDGGWTLTDGKYTKNYNIESTDKLPKPERTGFAFKGWQVVSEAGNWDISKTYSESDLLNGMYGTVELKALWDENAYNVNLDDTMQNGTVTRDPQAGSYGDPITLTPEPNEGYKYVVNTIKVTNDTNDEEIEVTANEDGTFTFNMPDSNVTVTATFTAINYTVQVGSMDRGSVTIKTDSGDVNKIEDANVGEKIVLNVTANNGYEIESVTFAKDSETTGTAATKNDDGTYSFEMPASNVTVTATFKGKSYTIVYAANNGSGTMERGSGTFGTATTLTANAFTKTGYEFKGWTTTVGTEIVTVSDKGSFNPDTYAESYTMTAVWEAKKVTVILDHGYENKKENLEVFYDSTYSGLEDAEREGYTFAGWYDGETLVTQENKVNKDTEHTLTAKWELIPYTITYELDTGSFVEGYVAPSSYDVTQSVTLPVTSNVIRNGYTFGGWYEKSDTNKTVVTEIKEGTTGNKTYCAIWNLDSYTITFELGNGKWPTGVSYENNQMSYHYTTPVILPEAESADPMYKFTGWSLAVPTESWKDTNYTAGTNYGQSHYGNITLTAVYDPAATFKVVEYKYAHTGDYLLTVADNLNDNADNLTQTYKFDGHPMYWTDAATYKVESADIGTFFLLIGADYLDVTKDESGDVTSVALKAEAYDKLKSEASAPATIDYDGDINTDDKVNIADANAVYQMVLSGGGYYSKDQLTDDERLMADMSKDVAEAHASIADVNAIVTIINNAANAN